MWFYLDIIVIMIWCWYTVQSHGKPQKNVHGLKNNSRCLFYNSEAVASSAFKSEYANMQNCFLLGNKVSNAPYLELLVGYQYPTLVLGNRACAKWKCCSSFEFFSLLFDLKYALYCIRTSKFRAEAERFYISLYLHVCHLTYTFSKIKTFLGTLQTPLHSCAEPNWWVKYGRRRAFESVWFGRVGLERQTVLNSPGSVALCDFRAAAIAAVVIGSKWSGVTSHAWSVTSGAFRSNFNTVWVGLFSANLFFAVSTWY